MAKFGASSAFDKATLASRKDELVNKKREIGDRREMLKVLTD